MAQTRLEKVVWETTEMDVAARMPIVNSASLRLGEAKRLYEAQFVSKLSDCIEENWETDTAFDFARDCGYISNEVHTQLTSLNSEVGKMLRSMHEHPDRFLTPNA